MRFNGPYKGDTKSAAGRRNSSAAKGAQSTFSFLVEHPRAFATILLSETVAEVGTATNLTPCKLKSASMKPPIRSIFHLALLSGCLFVPGSSLPALDLRIEPAGAGQIRLSWNEVAGATSYKVFRADTLQSIGAPGWNEVTNVGDLYHVTALTASQGFYCVCALILRLCLVPLAERQQLSVRARKGAPKSTVRPQNRVEFV
jgi:hypothetical protein